MTTFEHLYLSERGKLYYEIVKVKRAISVLEKFEPHSQKLENALAYLRSRDAELRQQAKDKKYIEQLAMDRLRDMKTRVDDHSQSQRAKAQKPRIIKGMDRESREKRNIKIQVAFANWKKSESRFFRKYGKEYDLSPSAIRKIIGK